MHTLSQVKKCNFSHNHKIKTKPEFPIVDLQSALMQCTLHGGIAGPLKILTVKAMRGDPNTHRVKPRRLESNSRQALNASNSKMKNGSTSKLFQKRLYDLLTHKFGLLTVLLSCILLAASIFQFGEVCRCHSHCYR